ncbi:MAG: sterol desaturase family protein [Bdellovibrionota bacterium]
MGWLFSGVLDSTFQFFIYATPMYALEYLTPRPVASPLVRSWWPQLLLLVVLHGIVSAFFGRFFANAYFFQKFNFSYLQELREFWAGISPVLVKIFSFVVFTFAHYWSHVARHRIPFLWRWCHQLHHSARRFETLLCYYSHPLEILFLSVVCGSAILMTGFGFKNFIDGSFIFFLLNVFTHTNIKTPRWLGFIIFRPEQHAYHHAGQECNFGTLPIWDILFGTFRNPPGNPIRIGPSAALDRDFWKLMFGRKLKF